VVQPPPSPSFCGFPDVFPRERKTPWEFLVEPGRQSAVVRYCLFSPTPGGARALLRPRGEALARASRVRTKNLGLTF
jgi:hypothetical protein